MNYDDDIEEPSKQPFVPPFIRDLMKNATEAEIQQAGENLGAYLEVLYGIYRQLEDAGTLDQVLEQRRRLQGSRYYLRRCDREICRSVYFELQLHAIAASGNSIPLRV